MDSRLYTKRYAVAENGSVHLPPHVRWRVQLRHVGRSAAGDFVDERITVVLEDRPGDGPHGFLPVIVMMSVDEAECLHAALGNAIAERKRLDEGGP